MLNSFPNQKKHFWNLYSENELIYDNVIESIYYIII